MPVVETIPEMIRKVMEESKAEAAKEREYTLEAW
jgi:hypothetical protein